MNPESLAQRAFKGLLWVTSSTLLITVARLINLIVLARLLTPGDFGVIAVALAIISIAQLVLQLGLPTALIQKPTLATRDIDTTMTVGVSLAIAGIGLAYAASPLIASLTDSILLANLIAALSLSFLVHALTAPTEALLRRNLEFRILSRADVVAYLIGYFTLSIAFAYAGFGAWSLAAAYIGEKAVRLIFLAIANGVKGRPGVSISSLKSLLRFGLGYTLAASSNVAATRGDKLAIAGRADTGLVGEYDRAYQLMVLPANVMQSVVSRVLYPALSRVSHDKSALRTNFLRGLLLTTMPLMPKSALCILMAPELVSLLLGSQWTESVDIFRIFCAVMLFRCTYKISDELAQACGAVYQRAWRQGIYALAVVAGAFLGSFWGIRGAAAGVSAAIMLNFILMTALSLRLTGASWSEVAHSHLPGLFCTVTSGLAALACVTFLRSVDGTSWSIIGLTGLLSSITWTLTIRLAPRIVGPDGPWLLSLYRSVLSGSRNR